MIYRSLLLFSSAGLLFTQCAKAPEVAPKVDYDQKSADIVQGVSPSVVGDWAMRRVVIKGQSYNYAQRDTVYQDFATLEIRPAAAARRSFPDPRYADFEGFLHFRSRTYPIQFELSASPERVVNDRGPQALFLFEYNFPVGSHPTESEEYFLQQLGLIGENFYVETVPGQAGMTWQGTGRGIDKIDLQRR